MARIPDGIVSDEMLRKIPSRIKQDNWAFFVLSEQDDPAVKCQNVVKLVRSLETTLELAGILTINMEGLEIYHQQSRRWLKVRNLKDYMNYYTQGAWQSEKYYFQSGGAPIYQGKAVEIANAVLKGVDFIVYDPRFTESKADSFPAKVK